MGHTVLDNIFQVNHFSSYFKRRVNLSVTSWAAGVERGMCSSSLWVILYHIERSESEENL